MKAPEKIYLQQNTTTDCYEEWWTEWFEARGKDTDIEYTRTDAFIEKAVEWLKNNVENYYYLDEAYDRVISIKNLNSDFKKYMKGE